MSMGTLRNVAIVGLSMVISTLAKASDPDLALHYAFDGDTGDTVYDSTANGNDGALVGAVTYETGLSGKAARFTSKSTYIISSAPGLNMNGWTGMTVSVWVLTKNYTTYGQIINRGSITAATSSAFELAAGSVYGSGVFDVYTNTASAIVAMSPANPKLALNTWYHLVGTYDGTKVSYYVNGILSSCVYGAIPDTPIWDPPDNKLVIGNMSRVPLIDWSDMYFNGLIDEVKIYNRCISGTEAAQLFSDFAPLSLIVSGNPGNIGQPTPDGYGNHSMTAGTTVTCSVPASVTSGDSRYFCKGWTGIGSVPSSGSTNVVSFALAQASVLTWQWIAEYYLNANAGPHGNISVPDGWHTNGAPVILSATADSGYHFVLWTGDVPIDQATQPSLLIAMDRAKTVTAVFAPDAVQTPSDAVLFYTFDDDTGTNVWDQSGNGNHGYLIGSVTHETGLSGLAPSFTSKSTYIVSSSPGLNMNGWTGMTASVWVLTKNYTTYGQIINRGSITGATSSAFELAAGYVYGSGVFDVYTNAASAIVAMSPANPKLALNTWYHLVGTYDGTKVSYYVNGILSSCVYGAIPGTPLWDQPGNKLVIGNMSRVPLIDWSDMYFDGLIDEVKIYNRALAEAEVVALYSRTPASNMVQLALSGNPSNAGIPTPCGYGTNYIRRGTTVTNSVASPSSGSAGIHYICTGWNGTGDIPTSGATNRIVATINSDSALTWNWRTEYYLDTAVSDHGSVNIGSGWRTNGAAVTVTATANSGYHFCSWLGDVPVGMATNNPITLSMNQPRSLVAVFASDSGGSTDGLMAHYTFDHDSGTNFWDESGNGNNGYLVGPVTYESSISGMAPRFTSKDTYLVSSSPGLNMNGWTGMTVSVWVLTKNYTTYGQIVNRGPLNSSAGSAFELAAGYDYGRGVFDVYTNAAAAIITMSPANPKLTLNAWYNLVGTYDGTKLSYYVNGVLASCVYGSATGVPIWDQPSSKLVIGNMSRVPYIDWSDMYFNGLIDEVKIYNRALDQSEITSLWGLNNATNTALLVVKGLAGEYGNPTPQGYGTNTVALGATGTVLTNSVQALVAGATTRYVCTGWTGTASVPASGATNKVVFTLSTNSTLTWQWRAEYLMSTAVTGRGDVTPGNSWYSSGSIALLSANAGSGFHFKRWTGNVPSGQETANPLTATMDSPRNIVAEFEASTYAVAGQVYGGGNVEGTIIIEAYCSDWYSSNRAAIIQLDEPGAYAFTNLPGGADYWIRAFRDTDNDKVLDPAEPVGGWSGNPLQQLSGNRGGISIYLQQLSAPQGITVSGQANGVTLCWNANPESGIAGYHVYKFSMERLAFERVTTSPVVGLSYVDHAARLGETCYYYVTAVLYSDIASGYIESPASAIVNVTVEGIRLWMPDYRGATGSTVRLRINISDASRVLGHDMVLAITYDPFILTPITQVNGSLATVEKTVLTEHLNVIDNGATATGRIEIATAASSSETNTSLQALGCSYENKNHKPIPIQAMYSNDGTNWNWINDGKTINDGNEHSVDLGFIANTTGCIVRVKDMESNRECRSDDTNGFVKVLRNNDDLIAILGVSSTESLLYSLRSFINNDLTVNIGQGDIIYLFELGDNLASANWQDAVIYVENNSGAGLSGQGRLFDIVFQSATSLPLGTMSTNAFVWAELKDQAGTTLLVDHSDTATFTVASTYMLGDINGDGIVNVNGDFTLAMKLAVDQREPTEYELMAGDIDGDGAITKSDATLIKRIVQNLPINPNGNNPCPDFGETAFETQSDELPGPSGYEISIGSFETELGTIIDVPVVIDNATSVACMSMRINFDGQFLTFIGVQNTTLSQSFDLDYLVGNGYVNIAMSSSNALPGGSGNFAVLKFFVATNANIGSVSDITISDLGLGNQYGGALGWTRGINVTHGGLAVTYSDLADSDNDGLSDRAEQLLDGYYDYNPCSAGNPYGTDSDINNPDTDEDGAMDGSEYRAGTDPLDDQSLLRVNGAEDRSMAGVDIRWPGVSGKKYVIDAGTNLTGTFVPIASNLISNGGTELFTDTNAINASIRFYRIRLDESP